METKVNVIICGETACQEIKDVLVDTGATLSAVNRRTAQALGIKATRRETFQTPQGLAELEIGLASITIQGKEVHQEVVILDEGPTLVGLLTLEQARFKVDTIKGELEPAGPATLL